MPRYELGRNKYGKGVKTCKTLSKMFHTQMRANKEARKKEMEEMERMKAQLLEEEASIDLQRTICKKELIITKHDYHQEASLFLNCKSKF